MKKLVLAITVAAIAISGCGVDTGSSSSPSSPAATTDEEMIGAVLNESADALEGGDYGVYCGLLSPAGVEQIEESGDGCKKVMQTFGGAYTAEILDAFRNPRSIEVEGAQAVVDYGAESGTMEKIHGTWTIGPDAS